jgi:hypothetical protein
MLHCIIVATLSIVTAGVAGNAARLWFQSSNVEIDCAASIEDEPERHILNLQALTAKSANLNKQAAIWTGVSAIFGAVTSIIGAISW